MVKTKIYKFLCIISFFLAWDQSDKFVKIYVQNLDGVGALPSEQVRCSFENS